MVWAYLNDKPCLTASKAKRFKSGFEFAQSRSKKGMFDWEAVIIAWGLCSEIYDNMFVIEVWLALLCKSEWIQIEKSDEFELDGREVMRYAQIQSEPGE